MKALLESGWYSWASSLVLLALAFVFASEARRPERGGEARAQAIRAEAAKARQDIQQAQEIARTARLDSELAQLLAACLTYRSDAIRLSGLTTTIGGGGKQSILRLTFSLAPDQTDADAARLAEEIRQSAVASGVSCGKFALGKDESAAGGRRKLEALCTR